MPPTNAAPSLILLALPHHPHRLHCHQSLPPSQVIPYKASPDSTRTTALLMITSSFLLQWKQCLPVLPPTLCHKCCLCPRSPPLDPEGDHLFSCHHLCGAKSKLSSTIKFALCHILKHVAPLAGTVRLAHDITLETPGLLPDYTAHNVRPADIGLQLAPPQDPTPSHPQFLAIDVTVPHIPDTTCPAAPPGLPSNPNIAHRASLAHQTSARNKFNRDIAPYLLSHQVALLPFSVDHLGGLGSFAHHFLFGKKPPDYSCAAPPSWGPDNFRTHPTALLLAQQVTTLPAILPQADTEWASRGRFGSTSHTNTPSQWAIQALGLNISTALATHLYSSIANLLRHHPSPKRTLLDPVPFRCPPAPPRFPGPTGMDAAATTPPRP